MVVIEAQTANGAKKISPFSVSIPTELNWNTMTSREEPNRNGVISSSEETHILCEDLSKVGVIGSIQLKRMYLNNNKKKLNKFCDLNILKKHEILRGKNVIPLYTLGATGMFIAAGDLEQANEWRTYDKYAVLRKLVFFQLYEVFKKQDEKVTVEKSIGPFTAAINRGGKLFHVLVVRGNENEIANFLRYESEMMPKRVLLVIEDLGHIKQLEVHLKPYSKSLRLTTDLDITGPFESMFYAYKDNDWIRETH